MLHRLHAGGLSREGRETLRDLLFFGNRVRNVEDSPGPGADRGWICFFLDGTAYVIGRSRLRCDQPSHHRRVFG